MTLTATGASVCFELDIEDLPEELRRNYTEPHDAPSAPAPLPGYTEAEFAEKVPLWRDLIESGQRTSAQVIGMVRSKRTLTEAQVKALEAMTPKPAEPATPAEETQADGEPIAWSQNLEGAPAAQGDDA